MGLAPVTEGAQSKSRTASTRPIDVLDLGAGTGKLTAKLAEIVDRCREASQVTAVEPDPADARRTEAPATRCAGR